MKRQLTLRIGIFQIRGISKYFSSVFHTCLRLIIRVVPVWICKFHVSNIVNKLISLSFQKARFLCRERTFFIISLQKRSFLPSAGTIRTLPLEKT